MAMKPRVARTAVSASRIGIPAATSAPNATIRMISVIGTEIEPGLLEILHEGRRDLLVRARVAELADEERGMSRLDRGHLGHDRVDLVHGLVELAADLEVDDRRVPVLGDLRGVGLSERRADVDHLLERVEQGRRVFDRGRELGVARR